MRKIPPTIATQHPDNASAPYWDEAGRAFISTYQEVAEAVACFQDLGVSEYMWDWEGKHADAAVIDRLFSDYHDYFKEHHLGRDKFLTFRIPNTWEEKGYNLLQAMTVILSSEDFAHDLQFSERPLFEVILPMTERAEQLIHMQQLFEKLAKFKSEDFTPDQQPNNNHLEMIPLVESVESQQAVGELLTEYVKLHTAHFGRPPEYMRLFIACSDPALTAGRLATLIANKVAISQSQQFAAQSGIPVFPFAGPGSLPFRGGLAPSTVDQFMAELPGLRTVTVQSSFRYDHPLEEVKAAIAHLEQALPTTRARIFTEAEQTQLINISKVAAGFYKETLDSIIPDMQPFFKAIPRRRDRRQHIGLLAYSRSSGQQKLPRAITFTAGFYSLGVPPEFIGIGRALGQLEPAELELLKTEYHGLTTDLEAAGRYLNHDNLAALAQQNEAWQAIHTDITVAEEILGVQFGPQTPDEIEHVKLSSEVLQSQDSTAQTELITRMAVLRKSLG